METIVAVIGIFGLGVAVVLYDSFSWGFVLAKCWVWFIMPVFVAAPALTIYQAAGLMLVASLFGSKRGSYNETIDGVVVEAKPNYGFIILVPWITLGIAACLHLFI